MNRAMSSLAMSASLVLASCAGGPPLSKGKPFDLTPPQQGLAPGIQFSQRLWPGPVPMQVSIVEVDLTTRDLGLVVGGVAADAKGEYLSRTTSSFVRETGAVVAINGGYFSPVVNAEGLALDAIGFSKSGGLLQSPPNTAQTAGMATAVVCFKRREIAILATFSCPDRFTDGLAAGPILVAAGKVVTDVKNTTRHPRSAIGMNARGDRLWLITIDGRQPGYSEGASFEETARILVALGATEALNLDGGGSTALVARDGSGKPRQLNRPIQGGVPGRERPVANHIGLFELSRPIR